MEQLKNDIYHGFLLTRSSTDQQGKAQIEYWLATDFGPALLRIPNEKPVLFISEQDKVKAKQALSPLKNSYELKDLDLKTFQDQNVSAVYTHSIHNSFRVRKALNASNIELLEADFRLHDRYLMERFIYGGVAFTGQLVERAGYTEVLNAKLKSTDYNTELYALSLDIECAMDGELFSIGLAANGIAKGNKPPVAEVLMIGTEPVETETCIHWYNNEKELLMGLCERIDIIDPDLIIGWNLINFDLRILVERAEKHRLALRIGRANGSASWRSRRGDAQKGFISIPGRVAIDGIDALRSATWSFPSFSLEHVAQTLLGRGKKVEGDVDDRIAEIVDNFHNNKAALARYNLEDCVLVLDIFAHTQIVDYLVLRSQMTGLELDRAGGSVAAFTNLYLPRLHRGGYVAPNLPAGGGLASPGGYVMNSKPGLYRNVLVLDFKSLYPSIIRTFKVDPMGLIEGLSNPADSIAGFKGAVFDREKHYLPDIITDLWQQRDQAKQDQDAVRSQAIKIIMNSFYGVLGSGGCRFYDQRLASSITMRGHEIMKTTSQWIEDAGYEVIYGDTDSTFVSLDDELDAEACQEIGNHLAETINQRWIEKLSKDYGLECQLEIEFETHFSRFLMPTIRGSEAGSKKRYAGLTASSKGKEERIIFKGLETVRTDWTNLARQFQAGLFEHVFHDRDPTELVVNTVKNTLDGSLDADLVYRKQLRRKLEQYVKNIPPQVKAARLADEQYSASGKSQKYQNKGWINYIITKNGPEPVEFLQSPIDYDHYVEKQLKPIADGILPFIGLDFNAITSQQIELF